MTTAAGRLWRRAPLWRLVLTAALAFGVLTALYPAPSVLHLPPWLHLPHQAPPPPAPTASQVHQQPGSIVAGDMPTEPSLHGTLSIAGRTMPLPAGDWHELVAARAETATEIVDLVLGRWQGGRLTGYLSVNTTTGPSDDGKEVGELEACNSYNNYAVKWVDPGHTCWLIRKTDTPVPGADGSRPHTLESAAIARMQALGVAVPPWLSAAVWSHSQGSEVMIYDLRVANARNPNDQSAALAGLKAWMTRFAPLLRRGFDGTLDPAAIPPVGRDPGFAAAQ